MGRSASQTDRRTRGKGSPKPSPVEYGLKRLFVNPELDNLKISGQPLPWHSSDDTWRRAVNASKRLAEARASTQRMLTIDPGFTIGTRLAVHRGRASQESLRTALKAAGLPE